METTETVTTGTLEAIAEAFNRHDVDAIMAFFAEDAVVESPKGSEPWGRRYVGQDEVREGFAARFAGIPDVTTATARTGRAATEGSPNGHSPERRPRESGSSSEAAICGPSATARSSRRTRTGRSWRSSCSDMRNGPG